MQLFPPSRPESRDLGQYAALFLHNKMFSFCFECDFFLLVLRLSWGGGAETGTHLGNCVAFEVRERREAAAVVVFFTFRKSRASLTAKSRGARRLGPWGHSQRRRRKVHNIFIISVLLNSSYRKVPVLEHDSGVALPKKGGHHKPLIFSVQSSATSEERTWKSSRQVSVTVTRA